MSFPERSLNQIALYWAAPIADGYGSFSYDDPVELECRWISSEKVLTDEVGNEVKSLAVVQVKQDLDANGMMLLATLDDLESGEFNDPVAAGALPIVRFDKIPDIRGTRFFRQAFLGQVFRRTGF